jgi:hypothetical protein
MKRETHGRLTMKRAGEFAVQLYGDNHCGVQAATKPMKVDNKWVSALPIKYEMECECKATLDARGFLFDQINVDNFFQSIKMTKLSCEQFAIDCARKLWRMILKENPDCSIIAMKLSLSPAPHAASMTFSFDAKRDGVPDKKEKKKTERPLRDRYDWGRPQ